METVGGQAVMEGVMMRAKDNIVTAVRTPKGKIVFQKKKVKSLTKKYPFKLPFIRGMISLFETLYIGMQSLNYSADVALSEDQPKEKKSSFDWLFITFSILLSLVLAIGIFKFIPLALAQLAGNFSSAFENKYVFNLTEGILKLAMFIGYVLVIGQMKDIKRVFQYHGAEHKAVNCYEAKKDLTVENVKQFSTFNPRCGTSFILFVIIISIGAYIFLPLDISFLAKLGLRIALLPLIAGVAYEVLKLAAKYPKNSFFASLSTPGYWVQGLTTNQPDDDQIEVAIFSLKKAIK